MDNGFQGRIRDEFGHLEFGHLKTRYFNSAYLGPSPARARAAGLKALERELDPSFHHFDLWKEVPERIRALLGDLLGKADPGARAIW